jgi:tetratricopeptide (TPR) repeat protein
LTNQGVALELDLTERTYYRHRIEAIRALAERISRQVLPPLRPESPLQRSMVGRDVLVQEGLANLREGRSVAVSGPSGMGKTTLAAAIAGSWDRPVGSESTVAEPGRVFWFTVRPGMNDQLASLAFALGYFLRHCGALNTWRQLVADQGRVHIERTMGLLRHDLASLRPEAALICIDEVDLLDPELHEHALVLQLVDDVKSITPVLLIGQRTVMPTDRHFDLTGLDQPQCRELLKANGVSDLPPELSDRLHSLTRGSPALLLLLAAEWSGSEDVAQLGASARSTMSIEVLLKRVWRRLVGDDRAVLLQLAVFRAAAPGDAWQGNTSQLERLAELNLIDFDGGGGIELVPFVRRFVYHQLEPAARRIAHLAAADLLEARGDFTEAMHHCIEGAQPARAVWLWIRHRLIEIDRGRAGIAVDLLGRISPADLADPRDRDALHATRGALLNFLGRAEDAEADLRGVGAGADPALRVYAQAFLGSALETQGRAEQALQAYRDGLSTLIGSPWRQEIDLRIRMSHVLQTRLFDLDEARREAIAARLESEIFHGSVEERAGDYAAARARYLAAHELASGLSGYALQKSRLCSHLGNLSWRLGDIDAAVDLLEQALRHDRERGDVVAEANDRMSLSAAYIVGGHHERALAEAEQGIALAQQLQDGFLLAGSAACTGEAAVNLGRLAEAEHFAMQSLTTEEEGMRTYGLAVLGMVGRVQCAFAPAADVLSQAIRSAKDVDDKYAEATAWRELGHVHRDAGAARAARDAYAAARRLYTQLGLQKEVGELEQALVVVS